MPGLQFIIERIAVFRCRKGICRQHDGRDTATPSPGRGRVPPTFEGQKHGTDKRASRRNSGDAYRRAWGNPGDAYSDSLVRKKA